MKRVINLLIVTLILICGVNAITMSSDQDDNLISYNLVDKGNTIYENANGFINESIAFDNGTLRYYYDKRFEFKSLNEDFYLIFQAYDVNDTITLMYRGDLQRNGTLYMQNFTFSEVGAYYFKFSPEYENEPAVIYVEFPTDYVGTYEYIEEKPETFTIIARTILGGGMKLIDINITVWKVFFYVSILTVMLAIALGLFGVGFILIKYTQKINKGGD